jgi:hypothetical protein
LFSFLAFHFRLETFGADPFNKKPAIDWQSRVFLRKSMYFLLFQSRTRVADGQGAALPNGRATINVRQLLHLVERGVHLLSGRKKHDIPLFVKTFLAA